MWNRRRHALTVVAAFLLVLVIGCTSSRDTASAGRGEESGTSLRGEAVTGSRSNGVGRPTIVVTTSILGDVVGELVGDQAEVVTIMPAGVDPHEFSPSAKQVDQIRRADVLIANGAGFEAGLVDVIRAARADGVAVYDAISAVEALTLDDDGHRLSGESGSGHEHDERGTSVSPAVADQGTTVVDPHFFTDPRRMASAVRGISDFVVANVAQLDAASVQARTKAYVAALENLDAELATMFGVIPAERRVLVTNHEVFRYFADRYGFEVVGAVIPGGATADEPSAADLDALARLMKAKNVRAVFADVASSDKLAHALAAEVGGDVRVVELFSESLGGPASGAATYLEMMRTNGQRIVEALR
ncbi:MAG: metal ABC transporter substrate-binding protein [Acidimicrobiales bacterium]|nr:metal ABC transporter substrate-binding protein [Acidimicrobiales bacterium]